MKAIALAYHNMGCAGLAALLRCGFEVQAVFTHTDNPNESIWFSSVAQMAAEQNIPVYAPENINASTWIDYVSKLQPDILFSFYYRHLLRQPLLDIPSQGCLNLHGSLLPKYRGRCPINWVLVNGETETGVTLHYMTPKLDDGDVVAQRRIIIDYDETAKSLMDKAVDSATLLLEDVLPKIKEGTAQRYPQDHAQSSYFGSRCSDDGEIDWSRSAVEVRNLIRAVTHPYPGAFSFVEDRKMLIWLATVILLNHNAKSGTVLSTDPLIIACGHNALQIDDAQVENGTYTKGKRRGLKTLILGSTRNLN